MEHMHRSSFGSSCDILEIEEEELNPLEHYNEPKSDRRSLACLEDDLNQLFEIFNRRSSSQRMQNAAGPSRKKSSSGASGRGSLKEAFGGQMASVKRSAKSGGYKNVAVGDSTSMASQYQGKDSLLEASSTETLTSPVQADFDCPSPLVENSQDEMHYYSLSASPVPDEDLLKTAKSSPFETPMFSASSGCASRARSSDGRANVETVKHVATRNETVPGSPKMEMFQKQDHADATSSHWSDRVSITRQPMQICPTPCKPVNKGSAAKSSKPEDKKASAANGVPSSGLPNGSRVKKPMKSVSRLVKPVIKTKDFVKRKSRKDTASAHSPNETRSEFNNALYPGSNHIVCPRCQCVLNDGWEEVEQDSPLSPAMSPSTEVELSPLSAVLSPCAGSPDNVFSDISTPTFNLNNTKEAVKARRDNLTSGERGEITESSISGPDECSSSTSIRQENNLGRPSSWDRPHMSKDARWQAIQQIRKQHGSVGLRNFNLLKKLGCGDIGTVYLAELIDTSCLFAIKVMDNEFLARRKKMTRAQTEREILRMLDHPFLPTLFCQFTSDNLSCLVMEHCPGGDLHVLRQMQPGRCFTEQAARFYVAEVLLALEYLHMLGVIYRDLKPENILVREDGHIMLSDFDLSLRCAVHPMLLVSPSTSGPYIDSSIRQPSCQVSCFGPKIPRRKPKPEQSDLLKPLLQLVAEPTDARSNSFVGTHEYLAPEIIKGEGHGSAVDWWTLGIFLFELLYGRTPFRGSGNEETLANVVLQGLDFPDSPLVSLHARDLIVGLLAKDPDGRLGSERGAAEIKQHPFFQGLNWALIRCAVPPDLPGFHRSNGVGKGSFNEKATNSNNSKYLEYNSSTGEHLEFEVF